MRSGGPCALGAARSNPSLFTLPARARPLQSADGHQTTESEPFIYRVATDRRLRRLRERGGAPASAEPLTHTALRAVFAVNPEFEARGYELLDASYVTAPPGSKKVTNLSQVRTALAPAAAASAAANCRVPPWAQPLEGAYVIRIAISRSDRQARGRPPPRPMRV